MKKNRSKILAVALVLTLLLGTVAAAVGPMMSIDVFPGVKISMDGKDVTPEGKEAFLYNDSTYVPLRFLAELLGVNVGWDAETGTVLLGEQPKVPMSYTPGTYTASAAGMMGDVKVEVTVTKDAITAVKVVEQKETPSIGGVALERIPAAIVDNQSLKIDTVSGATMTSKAILAAVEDAIKQAGGDVEALKNASVKTEKPLGDQALTADVVVIGAGGAGLSAALEAKDQGAGKVILLEKMAAIGGTTFTSQGLIGGYDSKLQKEKGIELTFEQMYDNLMSNASYHLDPALTTITLQKSGGTVDWLADRVKMDINDVKVGYGPLQMMHTVKGGGAGMAEPFNAALEEAGVELMLETRATELITDASGAVVGVRAESKGSNIEIAVKSVVIATGGYAYNPELTAMLTPELAGTWGIGFPGSTGDGLIMASNVGALLTHTDDMMCVLKDYEIMSEHNGTSSSANNSFKGLKDMIMVGAEGKRFVNEQDQGYMSQKLNSPIFDQMHKDGLGYVWCITQKSTVDANARLARGAGLEYITADTAEELAGKLGVPAEALAKTLADYNGYVEAGYDAEFRRSAGEMAKIEGTLVAVPLVPCEIITYGGIARNDKAEVTRADGTSIPGLYVAGEASANSAYMGFTLTNCFTWGRIAGESAAVYAK